VVGVARERDYPLYLFSVGLPPRREIMESPYNLVAGLDIHKKTVVVVVLQNAQPEQDYASSTFGTTQFGLKGTGCFPAAARGYSGRDGIDSSVLATSVDDAGRRV
jgi:hypothetical protein